MKRHGFDPLSFLFGALFLAVGASALGGADVFDIDPLRPWPLGLVVVGLVLAGWATTRTLTQGARGREPAESDAPDSSDDTIALPAHGDESVTPPAE